MKRPDPLATVYGVKVAAPPKQKKQPEIPPPVLSPAWYYGWGWWIFVAGLGKPTDNEDAAAGWEASRAFDAVRKDFAKWCEGR